MPNLDSYLRKIENEYKALTASTFWKEYITAISNLRKKASKKCETYDEVLKWQGEIIGYDKVLGVPDKLISIIREKSQESGKTE